MQSFERANESKLQLLHLNKNLDKSTIRSFEKIRPRNRAKDLKMAL